MIYPIHGLSIDLHPEEWEGVLRSAFEGASFGICRKKCSETTGVCITNSPTRQSQALKPCIFLAHEGAGKKSCQELDWHHNLVAT